MRGGVLIGGTTALANEAETTIAPHAGGRSLLAIARERVAAHAARTSHTVQVTDVSHAVWIKDEPRRAPIASGPLERGGARAASRIRRARPMSVTGVRQTLVVHAKSALAAVPSRAPTAKSAAAVVATFTLGAIGLASADRDIDAAAVVRRAARLA